MLISFVSAKGSPGVTTSVLALASVWPRTAVVVEADPAGGDIAAGLGRGAWPAGAGLTDLVVDIRTCGADDALRHRAVRLAPHCPLALAGLGAPQQAAAVPWERLGNEFRRIADADILVDCGRFSPSDGTSALVGRSDRVVVVTGSSLRSVRATARLVPLLDERGDHHGLVVVGPDRPYDAAEIADSCGAPLLGTLPDDGRTAAVWSDGHAAGRWFARSALQRTAAALAHTLISGPRTARGAAS
jgi:MinD-like ATPase involved in chromosome partitioning or flagellar assembly